MSLPAPSACLSSSTESVGEPRGTPVGGGAPAVGSVYAGKYRVVRWLGEGGMGVVVEAQHLHHKGRVALKLLSARADAGTAARLHQEAAVLARLRSPHVVRLLDSSVDDQGAPYLALELLDGETAAQRLASSGPLPPEAVRRIGVALCEALAEAHAAGVVHRDIKPSNVFLARGDEGDFQPRLLDFGVARSHRDEGDLTGGQGLVGSTRYASPEQLRDAHSVDARTDLWSLGVTLFELLSGVHPFGSGAPSAVVAAICSDPPPDLRSLAPACPRSLAAAVAWCLQKRPDLRPPDALALRSALLDRRGPLRPRRLLAFAAAASLALLASLGRSPLQGALSASPQASAPPASPPADLPAASPPAADPASSPLASPPASPASAPSPRGPRDASAPPAASAPLAAPAPRPHPAPTPPAPPSGAPKPASVTPPPTAPERDDFSSWKRQ